MSPRCPICRSETSAADPAERPFCSARCRQIDLGHWLEGRYRIPGEEMVEPETDAEQGEDPLLH